jgi:uncharacterized protein (TIGR00255 family)
MISMTGFGRAQGTVEGRALVIEIRSVNHRALDVKVRSRSVSAAVEVQIIRAVRAALARGSVQVSLDELPEGGERDEARGRAAGGVSLERIRSTHAGLEQLRRQLGLPQPVDLATVASFLRLERDRPSDVTPLEWQALEPMFTQALAALQQARAQEGQSLAAELRMRAGRLDEIVIELRENTRHIPARAQQRLIERLEQGLRAAAGSAVDAGRLAQEVALMADRLDVTEELARLEAHRLRLHDLLVGTPGREGVGRTLEFLLQELGRELNTLGSKSQDAEVSALVIAGKAELEKIREQAQNIE